MTPLPRAGAAATLEVFLAFLRLGLTSFGGPIAHLGYFREALVVRRRWIGEADYADLVALCHSLPGPTSSQVGMAIGLLRAGPPGMAAAFLGFTLPSAILMIAFAYGVDLPATALLGGVLAGLKAAAVAVVAQAVAGMAASLCPDFRTRLIGLAGLGLAVLLGGFAGQLAALAGGAAAGMLLLRQPGPGPADAAPENPQVLDLAAVVPRGLARGCLAGFFGLLALLPALAAMTGSPALGLTDIFYRAGALVFGGGHVVLPLLDTGLVAQGLVGRDAFLSGYAAAQAMPGPLFTFAGFLGAATTGPVSGVGGALVALAAIFTPSALLVLGALPFWSGLRRRAGARATLAGVNAAMVGVLAAAFLSLVLPEGVTSPASAAIAVLATAALASGRMAAAGVVLAAAAAGALVL